MPSKRRTGTLSCLLFLFCMIGLLGKYDSLAHSVTDKETLAEAPENTDEDLEVAKETEFTLLKPALKAVKSIDYQTLRINWEKLADADGYYVFRRTQSGSWGRIATVKRSYYEDTGLLYGETYTYTVCAYRMEKNKPVRSSYDRVGLSGATVLGTPQPEAAEPYAPDEVTLSWEAVDGAAGYYIYRMNTAGAWKRIRAVKEASFTDTGLSAASEYYYRVCTYRKQGGKLIKSELSELRSASTKPAFDAKVEVVAEQTADTRIKLTWTVDKKAYGYQIYRSTSEHAGYTFLAKTKKKTITDKNLIKGRTYYYQVRAYRYESGKAVYGAFCEPVKLTLPTAYDKSRTIQPLENGINLYIAGDSLTMDYSASGIYREASTIYRGSWGEFLQEFFYSEQVQINDYGVGGRSARSFFEEGRLDKIKQSITKGDYLFIEFGINDAVVEKKEAYTSLGAPDADGVYPVTEGTYKWYLYQYAQAAFDAGAVPVFVTPSARLLFDEEGVIAAHMDESGTAEEKRVNGYVAAMKQVVQELKENGGEVYLIDMFAATKKLYESAYAADADAKEAYSPLAEQLFINGDDTHVNKLGGFIQSAIFAVSLQQLETDLSKKIHKPVNLTSVTEDKETLEVLVNQTGRLTGYILTRQADNTYTAKKSAYWTKAGQSWLNKIQ